MQFWNDPSKFLNLNGPLKGVLTITIKMKTYYFLVFYFSLILFSCSRDYKKGDSIIYRLDNNVLETVLIPGNLSDSIYKLFRISPKYLNTVFDDTFHNQITFRKEHTVEGPANTYYEYSVGQKKGLYEYTFYGGKFNKKKYWRMYKISGALDRTNAAKYDLLKYIISSKNYSQYNGWVDIGLDSNWKMSVYQKAGVLENFEISRNRLMPQNAP